MFQTCPFCHSQVSQFEWAAHLQQHQRLRPDGQMHDHVTVAPQQRYQGSLQGQPQWYVHARCGSTTGMPEEIIRSYLADPFLYNDQSFCTGCQRYVPTHELFWQGTSQSLADYTKQLRIDYISRNQLSPSDFDWGPSGPVRRKASRSKGLVIALAGMGLVGALLFVGCMGVLIFAGLADRNPQPFPQPRGRFVGAPPFDVQAQPVHRPREPVFPELPPRTIPGSAPESFNAEAWANENRRRMEQFQADMERHNREMEERMNAQREQTQRRLEELRARSRR
jgi:hypothetical protein